MAKNRKDKKSRRSIADLPIDIQSPHMTLGDGFMTYIDGRLRTRLRKFQRDIVAIVVRCVDVNGPKGGIDQVCRIQIGLRGKKDIVVEQHAEEARKAFDLALQRAEHALHRQIERLNHPRHRPLKPGRVLADLTSPSL
jgi:ribosome-associated translation inhibitor RaiA